MRKERKGKMKDELIYKDESYEILGACFEIYKWNGCGFLEAVYQECLEIEMSLRNIPFAPQATLPLYYKERKLKQTYVPDFECYGKIIVELKAVKELCNEHRAQVFNYLRATEFQLGMLVNFGHFPKLEYERIVLTKQF
jgi:GxxExxY protein